MKTLILTLLLLPLTVIAQDQRIIREYDRFEDRTRYWTRPVLVARGLDLTAHFSFKGQGAGHDVEGFYLIFSSTADEWRFLKTATLYCLIDNQRVDLGSPVARDNDVKAGYSTVEVKEILMYSVKYQMLERISKARDLEVRIGETELSLGTNFTESVKLLLAKTDVVKMKQHRRR